MIESLKRCAGEEQVRLIRRQPDSTIMKIVEGSAWNLMRLVLVHWVRSGNKLRRNYPGAYRGRADPALAGDNVQTTSLVMDSASSTTVPLA